MRAVRLRAPCRRSGRAGSPLMRGRLYLSGRAATSVLTSRGVLPARSRYGRNPEKMGFDGDRLANGDIENDVRGLPPHPKETPRAPRGSAAPAPVITRVSATGQLRSLLCSGRGRSLDASRSFASPSATIFLGRIDRSEQAAGRLVHTGVGRCAERTTATRSL